MASHDAHRPSPTMLAVRKTRAAEGVELVPVPSPRAPGPDEALIRVAAAGICGTDLHVDHWTPSYGFMRDRLPVTLGHEFVGRVVALDAADAGLSSVSSVSSVSVGDRVVVRPSVTCGVCEACRSDHWDACETRKGIGLTRDGAFAPWVLVPLRNCIRVPQALTDDIAALAEPFSIALQALRVSGMKAGDRVLVMGPGTIGQAVAVLARQRGAVQVVVAGKADAPRLDVLRRMGFDALVDVEDGPLQELTAPLTGGRRFDVVFEATGVPETVSQGLRLLRRDGVLVVTGIHSRPLSLDLTALVRSQHQLRGSFRPPERVWPEVLALMTTLQTQLQPMVSHVLPLTKALEGFALAHDKRASKVLLKPAAHHG